MKAILSSLFLAALNLQAAPPEADRKAILSMAGTFEVDFNFTEDSSFTENYPIASKPYHEHALEVVVVAENTPERIILQHLLVVNHSKKKTDMVIKHWAQIWTWQDSELLAYSGADGIDEWTRITLRKEDSAGRWTQLVTSVDDTPRYEGSGKWSHGLGISTWRGADTRRPLPRREYSVRDDYDYLLGTNTHTVSGTGWLHFQDNLKVIDRGNPSKAIAHETGLNRYTRVESERAEIALNWWRENQTAWKDIRAFWLSACDSAEKTFSYTTSHSGTGLSQALSDLQKTAPGATETAKTLRPYLTIN
ncbi:DUF6607 family protein [Luteolibacter algae]|uniref:DUF6607 family protein n=1 Tax=Luteolibacter algae TaxID=454151 RepID=A0ABW5D3A5_9BACT